MFRIGGQRGSMSEIIRNNCITLLIIIALFAFTACSGKGPESAGIVLESWYPFGGRGHTQDHFGNEVITELAEKYGKTPAQIILRWHIQDGYITIPGSSNPEHIQENYDIFDFALTDEDMDRIRALDRQERYENW